MCFFLEIFYVNLMILNWFCGSKVIQCFSTKLVIKPREVEIGDNLKRNTLGIKYNKIRQLTGIRERETDGLREIFNFFAFSDSRCHKT